MEVDSSQHRVGEDAEREAPTTVLPRVLGVGGTGPTVLRTALADRPGEATTPPQHRPVPRVVRVAGVQVFPSGRVSVVSGTRTVVEVVPPSEEEAMPAVPMTCTRCDAGRYDVMYANYHFICKGCWLPRPYPQKGGEQCLRDGNSTSRNGVTVRCVNSGSRGKSS